MDTVIIERPISALRWIQPTLLMSLCQCNLECTSNCHLVDSKVRLAVIKTGVPQDGLHCRNVACSGQNFCCP